MNDKIKLLIKDSVELAEVSAAARQEGLVTLREIAINKMLEGVTTYEEVISMTG
jgi:general secretion pathway protein E